jgi:glycosyltransferase involved in cell wall biosynthesis
LLAQALQSCFAQAYRPLEIDVGDDSPTDDTQRLVAMLVVPSGITLRYHHNEPRLGQSANVARLFAEARGSRLMLLHDDDALLPGALTALDDAWQSAPDVVLAYGKQEVVTHDGELSLPDTDNYNTNAFRTADYAGVRRDLVVCALRRQVPNNAYLVETDAARAVGYRSEEQVGDSCDTDFSIRLAQYARGRAFVYTDRINSQYRLNATGLSRSYNVSWKFFDIVAGLDGLSADELAARDLLLEKIAPRAIVENALHGRRDVALRIIRSRFYRGHSKLKTAYHLSVIAQPKLLALRRLVHSGPFA